MNKETKNQSDKQSGKNVWWNIIYACILVFAADFINKRFLEDKVWQRLLVMLILLVITYPLDVFIHSRISKKADEKKEREK